MAELILRELTNAGKSFNGYRGLSEFFLDSQENPVVFATG